MRIDCHKCVYYYVTWDPGFPHGCRGMGFKGRRYPSNEVRRIMNGKGCLMFSAKKNLILPESQRSLADNRSSE